jgi:hypothetical protein
MTPGSTRTSTRRAALGAAIGPDGAVYVCNNGGFTDHGVRQERASDRTGQLVALDWPRPGGRRAFAA